MPGWLSAARVSVDAVNPGQVDAADAVQFMAQVELRRMAARLPAPLGPRAPRLVGGRVRRLGAWGHHLVRHALEMLFERLIALGHPLLVGIVHRDFLLQHKQEVWLPGALEALGDRVSAWLRPSSARPART